ncbi:MAG: translation initiation factor IF-2 subunit gamma [Candidatus Aenigmarchaeota archaeon]|nr:translation initiation factor IF-2 subunit gamma [Candidatus Aenigmarchaeota archaeon]
MDKELPEVNIGVLGHVSHGKTVLTQALTGKLTLQHSEELKRGITIKLGYADATIYKCPQCGRYSNSKKCPFCFADTEIQRTVSFVDSPGHEVLTATVLTGAGVIDGALLVIAANEKCPQPQTVEHLKALEIVGIDKIVIVQTKIDTVTKEQALKNYQEIKEFVKGTIAENAPIIPVSSTQKVNIDKVFEAIEKCIPTPKRDEMKNPKFLVIRSFDVNKPGTEIDKIVGGVLGGSIVEGKLKVGDRIEIKPGVKVENKYVPLETEIVSLRKAGKDIKEAGPGGLLGVLTKLDPSVTKADACAGSVVGLKGTLPKESYEISFEYFEFERVYGSKEIQKLPPIKQEEKILIHLANQRSIGLVKEVKKNFINCQLIIPLIFEKGKKSKIAISRQIAGRWRLVGYGILL